MVYSIIEILIDPIILFWNVILPVSFLSVVLKLEIISVVFVFLLSLDPLLQILLIRSYDLFQIFVLTVITLIYTIYKLLSWLL